MKKYWVSLKTGLKEDIAYPASVLAWRVPPDEALEREPRNVRRSTGFARGAPHFDF